MEGITRLHQTTWKHSWDRQHYTSTSRLPVPRDNQTKTNRAQTHREIKYKVLLCETPSTELGLVIPNSKSLNWQEWEKAQTVFTDEGHWKKKTKHNSSIAQDGSFLQPHSQKSRRGSRQCSEQPVKNIILCAWLNSFSTHLYSLFIATRDLICLPGIRWDILYHVPDRDQPLQPSQRTAIKIPHC